MLEDNFMLNACYRTMQINELIQIKRWGRIESRWYLNLPTYPMLILWSSKVVVNTRSMGHMAHGPCIHEYF